MDAQPPPGGDELRTRHYLQHLGARPIGHQEATMTTPEPRRPVTPTRIIPASAPLPARAPDPDELPPWRTPPPPPPVMTAEPPPAPPPPPPAEVIHHHIHEHILVPYDEEEEPRPRLWARLWDALVTWRLVVAILLALTPWCGGRSPVGIWGHTVHQARTEAGVLAAYVIAGVAVAVTWALSRRTGRALPRFLLVTTLVGGLGVLDWFDPILALTGVHR
ncbi:hypothetical protein [Streptomyces sp. F-1]|uniref:hypothetical protein n=1 Tax=Streptomyces sp. F-1 TaxID=463642 RepID=UPI0008684248|nr:hypothetical protein [Streptomyces sp. F-1]SFY52072.1 hypothetical protein STEPF1_05341 [Streptomyces sp. F-1]